jgi:hypothetical protein
LKRLKANNEDLVNDFINQLKRRAKEGNWMEDSEYAIQVINSILSVPGSNGFSKDEVEAIKAKYPGNTTQFLLTFIE